MDPMKRLLAFGLVLGASLSMSVATMAHGPDPAELLPARTLLYLELSDPPRAADELRALFKSSFLEDPRPFKARHISNALKEMVAAPGLFLGPEAMAELADWQVLNAGLTGFTPQGYPEVVGVLQGRPRFASVGMRALLLLENVERLRFPDGVEVYQIGEPVFAAPAAVAKARLRRSALLLAEAISPSAKELLQNRTVRRVLVSDVTDLAPPPPRPAPDAPPPPAVPDLPPPPAPLPPPGMKPAPAPGDKVGAKELPEGEFGLYCAMSPGCIIWGTTPKSVADVVRRTRGKGAGPSLARSLLYREASAGRRRPDLFIYVDAAALTQRIDGLVESLRLAKIAEARKPKAPPPPPAPSYADKPKDADKERRAVEEAEKELRTELAPWFAFRAAFNPLGMRYLTGTWTIHNGDATWRIEGRMRPGQTSPFLELLGDRPLRDDLLRGLPRDSYLLVAAPVAGGAKAWARLMRFADLCSAAWDQPTAVSKAIDDLEKKSKVAISRDVAARIQGVAHALRLGPSSAEDTTVEEHLGPGVLLIEATDVEAAAELSKLFPQLLTSDAKAPAPRTVTVGGQTIESLCGDEPATEGEVPKFWGRRGNILVLGWRRADVVTALADWKRPLEFQDHPRALVALRDLGPVRAAALFSGRQMFAVMTRIMSRAANQAPKHVRDIQYLRELSAPMALMPPTLFTLRCTPDRFCAELTQPEMRTASATVIDIGLAWVLDQTE
jgi:hypothetical protein